MHERTTQSLNVKSMARTSLALLLAALILTQAVACSLFASGNQTLTVASDPSGAKVTINGAYVGTTPCQYSVRRNQEAAILVTKPGYESVTRTSSRSLSTVGILDVIGGCIWLVPFVGLAAPGAWELEPANFTVAMSPAEAR